MVRRYKGKNLYVVSFTIDEEALRSLLKIPRSYRSAVIRRHLSKLRYR